ncbi:glutathione S-transferase [Polyplosphaeria fusca]|uniref:Glutathione S-transferase n=1 Tax=Polyplosphaeria fusca TaxID=682080 RepID=A0A9P4UXZ9_9PLEO|nr:glutathione S-transferase [Polyplosphaeria fusca]
MPEQTIIPTIHNLAHSQAFRILWALEEFAQAHGIKYHVKNYQRIRGPNPELKKIDTTGLGKSPILTLETTDGSPPPTIQIKPGVLIESRLILHYVHDTFGQGMWDTDPEDRARDLFFEEFGGQTIAQKSLFPMLFEVIPGSYPWPFSWFLPGLFKPVTNFFKTDILDAFRLMEDALSDEKPWFAGKRIGLSDFNMQFSMEMARQRGYFRPEKFPKIKDWFERIRGRDAYKKAMEKGAGFDLVTFGVKGGKIEDIGEIDKWNENETAPK